MHGCAGGCPANRVSPPQMEGGERPHAREVVAIRRSPGTGGPVWSVLARFGDTCCQKVPRPHRHPHVGFTGVTSSGSYVNRGSSIAPVRFETQYLLPV